MSRMRAISRPREGDRLGEIVAEGEDAKGDEDIEVLFGGEAEVVVALHLPGDAGGGAIGERLDAADLDFADLLADAAFEDGEWNGCEISSSTERFISDCLGAAFPLLVEVVMIQFRFVQR